MESEHRRIEMRMKVDGGYEIAATLHRPAKVAAGAPLIVGLPGAGYARGYFDLPQAGYSQAEHLVARGTMLLAIDHLGAGDSSIPPHDVTTLEAVAAAGDQAVKRALADLRADAITPGVVIGCGQSMGGHIAVAMQAWHRSFDAIIVLGSGMLRTNVPDRPGTPPPVIPEGAEGAEISAALAAQVDWPWLFHWEDSAPDLVAADLACGMPVRHTASSWASTGIPGLAFNLTKPGKLLPLTAMVDVPVLVGMGERDVTLSPAEELATFTASDDLSAIRVRNMAHMHNFADTRMQLWRRIDAFVVQVAFN
ncbi:alpha/beta hydrolase [Sphingomonas crocodyli]|uniref:Alpha/beta fold hydrolase n=1 Tax=Sphingomonas crocodyli TaxID=1979270 RepID=A0A437MAP0_9SPHN|nr:alpha/beta fold hydrolase [Sphingomonas crocodyli]RVT94719.1 alpha/beta fold hydrolase [Sphingomonas crocodyli]